MNRGRGPGPEHDFRWRGTDVSRLEGLSDGVFALALALLLLSGEVPTRISELRLVFEQILPFAASFAIIGMIWHANYLFFRRYGLCDGWTAFLNGALLFVVLLFAYPLKLVFALVSEAILGIGAPASIAGEGALQRMLDDRFPVLPIYAAGFGVIYVIVLLLYRHAWTQRDGLELDRLERAITRQCMRGAVIMIAFALGSILLWAVLPERLTAFAGWIFFGIGPAMGVHGWRAGVERERVRRASGSDG